MTIAFDDPALPRRGPHPMRDRRRLPDGFATADAQPAHGPARRWHGRGPSRNGRPGLTVGVALCLALGAGGCGPGPAVPLAPSGAAPSSDSGRPSPPPAALRAADRRERPLEVQVHRGAATAFGGGLAGSAMRPSDAHGRPVRLGRWAPHAFFHPIVDDALPPRWSDPLLGGVCADGTEVRVDGAPMHEGAAVPQRLFELRWTAVDCHPFGADGPVFGGTVTLLLAPDGRGDWAVLEVDAQGLRSAGPPGPLAHPDAPERPVAQRHARAHP